MKFARNSWWRSQATPLAAGASVAAGGVQPARVDRVNIAAVAELRSLGPGLEFTSRGRFRCDVDAGAADVLLVPPRSPATLHALRQRLGPSVDLVVVDRRGACPPRLIADMLDGGATAVVIGASATVLTAHLSALARRKRLAADQ